MELEPLQFNEKILHFIHITNYKSSWVVPCNPIHVLKFIIVQYKSPLWCKVGLNFDSRFISLTHMDEKKIFLNENIEKEQEPLLSIKLEDILQTCVTQKTPYIFHWTTVRRNCGLHCVRYKMCTKVLWEVFDPVGK